MKIIIFLLSLLMNTEMSLGDPCGVSGNDFYISSYQSSCFKFVMKKRSWSIAKKDCSVEGWQLVEIMDQQTEGFIYGQIKQYHLSGCWVGASRKNGLWEYLLDELVPAFIDFIMGSGSGNCARMTADQEGFYPTTCDKKYYYICEKDQPQTTKIPTTSVTVTTENIGSKAGDSNSGLEGGVVVGIIALVFFVVFAIALLAVLMVRRKRRAADDWRMPIVNQSTDGAYQTIRRSYRPDLTLMEVSCKGAGDSFNDESECYYNCSQLGGMAESNDYKTFTSKGSYKSSSLNGYMSTLQF